MSEIVFQIFTLVLSVLLGLGAVYSIRLYLEI